MNKPSKIVIEGIEYNLLTDDDLGELIFKERLAAQAEDIVSGKTQTIPWREFKEEYAKFKSRSF